VKGAQQALRIIDNADLRHIAELTFTDKLKALVYQQSGVDDTMSSKESEALMVRRNYLRHQHAEIECHPFSWYLANVAMSAVVRPSEDADHFGKLRPASSGLCLGGAGSEMGIELVVCHEHLYEHQLLIEMTTRGTIVRAGSCLEPAGTAAVAFVPCEEGSPRQRWWLADGRLTPVTAPRKCLSDSPGHIGRNSHLAMLNDCASDSTSSQRWSFINF